MRLSNGERPTNRIYATKWADNLISETEPVLNVKGDNINSVAVNYLRKKDPSP